MKAKHIKTFYRGNLPHIQPIGAQFFVTFRLKGSIPPVKLFQLRTEYEEAVARIQLKVISLPVQEALIYKEQKRFFLKYDQLLDKIQFGPHYLKQPEIAQLVISELHRFDHDLYDLICYCIMSNHVHMLIDTGLQIPEKLPPFEFGEMEFEPLQNIRKRIKGPSAVYANRVLNLTGKFWQRESYDHYVRNEKEFWNIAAYILDNPVKAKLVDDWGKYPYAYLKVYDDGEPGQ